MASSHDRTLPSLPYAAPAQRGDKGPAAAELPLESGRRAVVPVVREEAQVVPHEVEAARVRVSKQVSEREELVSVPLVNEHVRVERVPIGRTVERAPEVRQEGDTTIVPVIEEVLVVERKILLKEEIRITRERAVVQSPPQRVRLRDEHVEVERVEPRPRPRD
ncbi:MAG TPA: YsnF/AvaK domain-containing protein [Polyangiaceae bacterium]|nr:YsnF/AvaK domain-containing protein [Polyangiaceae bacterium]